MAELLIEDNGKFRFGKQSRAFVEQRDWSVIAGKLETLYRQVIAGRTV